MAKEKILRVGISAGDPNGIGLEVALKAFDDNRMLSVCTPIIYANEQTVKFHAKVNEIDLQNVHFSDSIERVKNGKINIVETWTDKVWIEFGQEKKEAGAAALKSIKEAVEDLASNSTDVLITAPINKASIQSDDFKFPGHTEYLANYANEDNPLMILVNEGLRVALACGHMPLKQVSDEITQDLLISKLQVFSKSLSQDFGIGRPRIAVLALNPHSGDNGLLGLEEIEIINPAIKTAQEQGILAFGAFAADGFFGSSMSKDFDGVLAMYHDQGLAPFKALSFGQGVNFTAGLPIVRTSPDHGTAFDIAGKGVADASSFRQAIYLACDIYEERAAQRKLSQNALVTESK